MKIVKEIEEDSTLPTFEEATSPWQLIIYAKHLLKQNPACSGAYIVLAEAHILRKEYQLAIEAYRKALELIPNNCDIHYKLAVLLCRFSSNIEESVEHFRLAMELKPKEPKFVSAYAEMLIFINKPEEALFFAQTAAALDPENLTYKNLFLSFCSLHKQK